MSRLWYLFIDKGRKTGGHITFAKYIQNFTHHPAVKDNSICRGNYW